MAAGVGPGDGTVLVFASNEYVPTNISMDGISVASIGTGGLEATVRTYTAGNIVDWGTMTIEVEYSGAITVPTLGGAPVAFEIKVRGVVNDNFSSEGYIENWSFNIPQEDKMTGTMVVRLTQALIAAADP